MKIKLKIFLLTLLSVLALATTTFAAVPPANAEIGNQATLEYVDGTGLNRTVLSNIVITTVNPVYGVDIDPNVELIALNNQQVNFVHTVTNLGNIEDNILLETANVPTGMTIDGIFDTRGNKIDQLTKVSPGASVTIIVKATVTGAADAVLDGLNVIATSAGDGAATDFVTDKVTIKSGAIINVYKRFDKSSGTTDENIVVNLATINSSTQAGNSLEITDALDTEFSYVGEARFTIDGGTNWKTISTGNTVDNVTLTVSGQNITIINGNQVPEDTGNGLDDANFQFEFTIRPIVGNARIIPNTANYSYHDGSESVAAKDTNTVTYEVLQYAGITFTGQELGVVEQGALFKFENIITNTGNGTDTFDVSLVQDEFPAGTEFFLAFDSGTDEFEGRVPLIDTTGSGEVDTGAMIVGETKTILLWVQLPREAVGADYKINKLGESYFDSSTTAVAEDIVKTINPATVDITNNYSLTERPNGSGIGRGKGPEVAPVTELSITPGQSGYFNLYVNNVSGFITDEYILEVSTDPTFAEVSVPEGITVTFETPQGSELRSTGPVDPGNFANVRALVEVDQNTLAGNVSLYFRAISLTTGAYDIKHDMVKVGILRNLSILPNNEGETYAGTSLYYTHTIKNGGNVLEGGGNDSSIVLIRLNDTKNNKFASTSWLDVNNNGVLEKGIDSQITDLATLDGLVPGESIQIFVEVLAGLKAQIGDINTTTVRLDVSKGAYNVSHPDVKVEDVTTIIADSLIIDKYQGSADGFDPSNPANFTKDQQTGSAGGYIYYRILVTNTGTTAVDDVVIEDIIPQYTTMSYGGTPGTPGVDSKPSWRIGTGGFTYAQTIPEEEAKGIIKATIGTLAPSQTAELYFNVRIDGADPAP